MDLAQPWTSTPYYEYRYPFASLGVDTPFSPLSYPPAEPVVQLLLHTEE